MSALEPKIDDLYQLPLAEFTEARGALAKTLKGADAKRVKSLAKPTVVPWAANQLYWKERATYDRLMQTGERLRRAQLDALAGKRADVRTATDAHRQAISQAVSSAERLASSAGSHAEPAALMRTFEALSLMPEPPAPAGRLTKPLEPAGFAALAGVAVRDAPASVRSATAPSGRSGASAAAGHHRTETATSSSRPDGAAKKASDARAAHARERLDAAARKREAAARKQHDAAVNKAKATLARAEAAAALARSALQRAERTVSDAQADLQTLQRNHAAS
jgi:hypothetical protein